MATKFWRVKSVDNYAHLDGESATPLMDSKELKPSELPSPAGYYCTQKDVEKLLELEANYSRLFTSPEDAKELLEKFNTSSPHQEHRIQEITID